MLRGNEGKPTNRKEMIKMKIDKRKKYGIMLDTETANTIVEEDGKLDMRFVLPYDIGFAVIDSKGNVYEKFSFVNEDIFCDEYRLMQSAYYCDKIPQYIRQLAKGERILKNTYEIRQIMLAKIKEYNCRFVCAHNMRFDHRAMNNLMRWTTKSKYRYFFPRHLEVWDTMLMANDIICKMPTYRNFCEENDYICKNGQLRKTAEILYRFISQDNEFIEEHTGLEDVLIEVEILKYCQRQHKSMRKKLFQNF
jgi:hypothetical protein